jgi:hypothetical protein
VGESAANSSLFSLLTFIPCFIVIYPLFQFAFSSRIFRLNLRLKSALKGLTFWEKTLK